MNKKVLMTVVLAGATSLVMAQKPTEGNPSSLEVQLNLAGENNTVIAPSLKYRYFLSSNLAIRFGLGYNSDKTEENFTENPDGTGATGSVEMKSSSFEVSPGVEYHFAGTDRLSPYLGVALTIGSGKYTETGSATDGVEYVEGLTYDYEAPVSMFGFSILAGMDYYVAENLFVGAELGWGSTSTTFKEAEGSASFGGTTNSYTEPESKSSSAGFGSVGGVRIGWRF